MPEFKASHADSDTTAKPDLSTQDDLAAKSIAQAGMLYLGKFSGGYASIVDFDVAVTTEEAENAQASGGIRIVSVFRADGSVESQTANSSVRAV